jgi:hypothetical protein
MPVVTKVQPLDKDIEILLSDTTPAGRARLLREFAKEQINEATQVNAQPPQMIIVDGQRGASIEQASADSTIVATWQLLAEALLWISTQLIANSPVSKASEDPDPSVAYLRSHKLYADGLEITPESVALVAPADEYTFANIVPYARKLEMGASSQAPDGIFEAVALMARQKFGNIARINFTYVSILGIGRQPGINVRGR